MCNYQKDKETAYRKFLDELPHTIDRQLPLISNLANLTAQLNQLLDNINWVGFYILQEDVLYLGPFQGLPACTVIGMGKGVCGTAALSRESQLVADVHQFAGHIACDANSRSEIVIPICDEKQVYGVLDIDSPLYNNFTDTDREYLERLVQQYLLPLFQENEIWN